MCSQYKAEQLILFKKIGSKEQHIKKCLLNGPFRLEEPGRQRIYIGRKSFRQVYWRTLWGTWEVFIKGEKFSLSNFSRTTRRSPKLEE